MHTCCGCGPPEPGDEATTAARAVWHDPHMAEPELVRLDADGWRDFRDVRLAALADSPGAFGSRHADWVHAHEERWRARLTDVPLTLVARGEEGLVGVVSGAPSSDHVEEWQRMIEP